MKAFLDDDFLLQTETAQRLYHEYAKPTPILDYHCHLEPSEIANDISFENITKLWLGADHYKWRIMRSNGVPERFITGDASDEEKFHAFAKALPKCIGNPMYHWCHLELSRYFGINETLSEKNYKEIYEKCNEILKKPDMTAKNLIKKSNVTLVCTTDDPVDDLNYHEQIKNDTNFDVKILPAWRPDLAMSPEKEGFADYISTLSEVSGVDVKDFSSWKEAMRKRLDYFEERGAVVADHGLDYAEYRPINENDMDKLIRRALTSDPSHKALSDHTIFTVDELKSFRTMCMLYLGSEYAKRGWAMQLHYGAKRENNDIVYKSAGANAGIDCINPTGFSAEVADLLNALNNSSSLPKTIIYSLNPTDNALIGTMIGAFQGGGWHGSDTDTIPGKIQQGAAWWFNDHKYGMQEHIKSLASLSILGNFIGMLTDSRSFISYPRHEYFRRILCNYFGNLVENGEYPADFDTLGEMVKDISYYNAVRYFGFDL